MSETKTLKKIFYTAGGIVALILGLIGIPVPMLPTTPFLLLAAFLFAKSSNRLYNWLIHNRYLGNYIRNYREHHGIPLKVKLSSIALLWITILYSAFRIADQVWLKILLIVIAVGVSIHILSLKTIRKK